MIRLTNETKKNKKGEDVDASLYLILFDSLNLAIVEGDPEEVGKKNALAYYSDVRLAFSRALDIAIKHSCETLELETILQRIGELDEAIKKLPDCGHIKNYITKKETK